MKTNCSVVREVRRMLDGGRPSGGDVTAWVAGHIDELEQRIRRLRAKGPHFAGVRLSAQAAALQAGAASDHGVGRSVAMEG